MERTLNVKIIYKNFQAFGLCHIGLGVGGMMTEKVLNAHNIPTQLHGITKPSDIDAILSSGGPPVTHIIIEAPWIPVDEIAKLCNKHRNTQFIVRSHSQIAFLQVDHKAFQLIREYGHLEEHTTNFKLAVNNKFIGNFVQEGYHKHCLFLPNLYWDDRVCIKHWRAPHNRVKCGSFGALRLQKNHTTSAGAALILGQMFGYDIQFYMNSARDEHTGVLNIVKDMFTEFPNIEFKTVPWQPWAKFRHHIEHLDVHFQLSATESFNITCADAVSVGVPCVVGPAIDWLPDDWKVNIDDPMAAAIKANQLMHDPHAGAKGKAALTKYSNEAVRIWLNYLYTNVRTMPDRFA